jgi:hypothetical protein
MYAKLVVGNTTIHPILAMRDIGRLITSDAPSLDLLSGFSTASSVIVDDTPAGWSYVGSTAASDRPGIAAVGSAIGYTNDTHWNLAFSAPTAEDESILKYAILNIVWRNTANTNFLFALTGAQSVTDQGVATNEGPRGIWVAAETFAEGLNISSRCQAGDIIHLIATPRHITIINEAEGLSAVWETSNTDPHRFFNTAPFVQYNHCSSNIFTRENIVVPTTYTSARSTSILDAAFAVTDTNTGVFYGTYDVTRNLTANTIYLAQTAADHRLNSITENGLPRYQISPVFFQMGNLGYPTQYISGTVPIFWASATLGSTGDNVDVSGDTYTYFNCGTGFGVIMKTD